MTIPDCTASILEDEESFYYGFTQDLLDAKQEVIIYSHFITVPRLRNLIKCLCVHLLLHFIKFIEVYQAKKSMCLERLIDNF